jgi:uroporphyrinogen decarboxylase
VPDPEEAFAPVLEAVRLVRSALRPDQAVVGFCGGPFTVAGYLVEGKPSREFATVKALMYGEPAVWHALMEKLAETFAAYVAAKVRAGADVVQLFDSWVGALSPGDYREFVAPYSARILAAVDAPTIHFGTGTATLLADMAEAGGDVIGLDWRIPLDRGWAEVGDRAVQGNLDPSALLAPWQRLEAAADDVLARAGGRAGHIFNLGHGVFPQTDPDVLSRLREHVHARTTEPRV